MMARKAFFLLLVVSCLVPSQRILSSAAVGFCCSGGFTGMRPLNNCTQHYYCSNGTQLGNISTCAKGLIFDEQIQACNFPGLVAYCRSDPCAPTTAPTMSPTTKTRTPTHAPSASMAPTTDPGARCCPDKFTGARPAKNCFEYYNCLNGAVMGGNLKCTPGLLFDVESGGCNFASAVKKCHVDPCGPTAPPTRAPTSAPTRTPQPTTTPYPTPSYPDKCCPPGFSGLRAMNDCKQYYTCADGVLQGGVLSCGSGLIFDATMNGCNFRDQVKKCHVDLCRPTRSPTSSPTGPMPSARPSVAPSISPMPTITPQPTPLASAAPTIIPTKQPSSMPSLGDQRCCPEGIDDDALRAFDDCKQYYICINGKPSDPFSCAPGLLFDDKSQKCVTVNKAEPIVCRVDSCGRPTASPTTSPAPTTQFKPTSTPLSGSRAPAVPSPSPTKSPSRTPRTRTPTAAPTRRSPTITPTSSTGEPTFYPTPPPTITRSPAVGVNTTGSITSAAALTRGGGGGHDDPLRRNTLVTTVMAVLAMVVGVAMM